jgi:hypothetical protein
MGGWKFHRLSYIGQLALREVSNFGQSLLAWNRNFDFKENVSEDAVTRHRIKP